MDELKAASLALAREALVPSGEFDPASRGLTLRLEKLLGVLSATPPSAITPGVAEYVYFPLHSLLQQSKLGARPTELLLRALTILVSTAWRTSVVFDLQKAQQLTAVTTYLLSPGPPNTGAAPLDPSKHFLESPTSLHAAGFGCLHAVFESAAARGFGPELGRAPTMAHIIVILLTGLQHDTSDLDSQKQSILALTSVLRDIIVVPDHRALVLPRIASKLAKFVAPANRKHFSVKILAIACLREAVTGCLSDASFSDNEPSRIRTREWIERTAEPLTQTFQVLQSLLIAVHSSQTGRPELVEGLFLFASAVYSECSQTMQKTSSDCLDTLLEMLLLCSSQTVNVEVAKQADRFIQHSDLAPKQLETGLVRQLQALPSTIESPDEQRVLMLLRSLQKTLVYVNSAASHEAVLDSIVASLPLSVAKTSKLAPQLKQIQSVPIFDPASADMIKLSELGLTLPLSAATQDLIYQVVSEIGKSRAAETLVRLCETLDSWQARGRGSLDGTLVLWCAAALVRSMPRGSDLSDIIAYCFEDITSSMDVHSAVNSDTNPASAAHTALCCYVIGEVAINQGSLFSEYLVDILHPLFSMLGDSQGTYIRYEAQTAISKVAFACGYPSPAELALSNKDYLVDGIATQLNTMNFTPGTTYSLAALIYVSGSPIIPYLDDVFSSLFVLLDHYQGYSQLVKSILVVFGSLTSVIDRSIAQPKAITADPVTDDFIPSFGELLVELNRRPEIDPSILDKKIDLGKNRITEVTEDSDQDSDDQEDYNEREGSESDDEPQDMADPATEKWDSPIAKPVYITIEKIALYCDKFMTHESPEIRRAVLTLFTKLTPYLALSNERFLPLVHKTWPEAISRVFDPQVYIVEEGFRCLTAITKYAKEFVASRVDSLWPKLAKKFADLFKRPWPQFSNERLTETVLVQFMHGIFDLSDVSLMTLESMMRALRPALLRGEFPMLKTKLQQDSRPALQDLAWLVLLQEPVIPTNERYHSVMPVYSF